MGPKSIIVQRTLSDIRDGNSYTIRKLADGNCWMTENLRLELSTTKPLTNTDTDLNSRTSWTPERSTETTLNHWGSNGSAGTTGDINDQYAEQTHSYTFGNATVVDGDGETQRKGVLYNWYTATARSGSYAMNSGYALDSICPKGWKLFDVNQFLYSTKTIYSMIPTPEHPEYNFGHNQAIYEQLQKRPFSLIIAGNLVNGSIQTQYGDFWQSSAYYFTSDGTKAGFFYHLHANNNYYLDLAGAWPRIFGMSVRCVAR